MNNFREAALKAEEKREEGSIELKSISHASDFEEFAKNGGDELAKKAVDRDRMSTTPKAFQRGSRTAEGVSEDEDARVYRKKDLNT